MSNRPPIKMVLVDKINRDNKFSIGTGWQATMGRDGDPIPGQLNFKWGTYQAPQEIVDLQKELERLTEKYYINLTAFTTVPGINTETATTTTDDDF